MRHRAKPSGVILSEEDAAIVKGMLARGDRQHDIASWFGVNGGRIGEIASGVHFKNVAPAPYASLPPPGPYLAGRQTAVLMQALAKAREALDRAETFIVRESPAVAESEKISGTL
jgi:hypothetical protein